MRKVVQFSKNQRVYSSQDGEMYRVPIGDKYEVSVISTAYSYGGSLGLYRREKRCACNSCRSWMA